MMGPGLQSFRRLFLRFELVAKLLCMVHCRRIGPRFLPFLKESGVRGRHMTTRTEHQGYKTFSHIVKARSSRILQIVGNKDDLGEHHGLHVLLLNEIALYSCNCCGNDNGSNLNMLVVSLLNARPNTI